MTREAGVSAGSAAAGGSSTGEISVRPSSRVLLQLSLLAATIGFGPGVDQAAAKQRVRGSTTTQLAGRCSALAASSPTGGRIVSAGLFSETAPPAPGREPAAPSSMKTRSICRVMVIATPAPGAAIHIELWLPFQDDWNGKFFGTSNGGLESIDRSELAGGVRRGFATAGMDFGIGSALGPKIYRVGIDNPEFAKNWAYRGVHMMTIISKQVLATYYGRKPSRSLFVGASGGGYQALGEAQRYPADYDGIIIGAPSINYANMGLSQGYRYIVSHRSETSTVSASLLPILGREVMAQCDGVDGLADGIIDDPRRCQVNWKPLACKPQTSGSCLQPDQISTLEAIYGGLRDPRDGRLLYPGFTPGAELSGGAQVRIADNQDQSFINDETPGPLVWALGPSFTTSKWTSINFGADGDTFRRILAPYENSTPDFAAFAARGGKLMLYAGWGEANANPTDIVNFFQTLQQKAGGGAKAARFSRLFMAPGMFHHVGGPGPNLFGQNLAVLGSGPEDDFVMAMDSWIATGRAPDRLIATKFAGDDPSGRVLRTRPLCPFPKVARWDGRGSIDDATQFRCVDAK